MRTIRLLCFFICVFFGCGVAFSPYILAGEGLKQSIERLNTISKDKEKSTIDNKLIKAIDIIDGMEEARKWKEVGKLIYMENFTNSMYFDELLYIYMAHLANEKRIGAINNLWGKMSAMRDSIHVFPSMLIRLFVQPNKKSVRYKIELERIIEYINVTPKETLIHGAMIEGNFLFGYTVKEDFSSGVLPKLYTMKEYKESTKPLNDFSEETQYIGILEASNKVLGVSPTRSKQLAELYEKGGKKEKAATIYYNLSIYYWNRKKYETADKYINLALKNNPSNADAQKLLKDISLTLVLKGKEKPAPPKKMTISKDDSFLIPSGKKLTKGDLKGKSKKMLRLMRNEVFAKYGRAFRSEDLHNYFTKKSWYKINPDYTDDLLNAIDRHNILLIREAEPPQ